jgi:hypothetical protein
MRGAITSLPSTPSRRGAQLKSTGKTLPLALPVTRSSRPHIETAGLFCKDKEAGA